jgi:hypothetical protein
MPGVGGVPEWLKGTDCKSVGARLRWFESNPLHQPACDTTQCVVLSQRHADHSHVQRNLLKL